MASGDCQFGIESLVQYLRGLVSREKVAFESCLPQMVAECLTVRYTHLLEVPAEKRCFVLVAGEYLSIRLFIEKGLLCRFQLVYRYGVHMPIIHQKKKPQGDAAYLLDESASDEGRRCVQHYCCLVTEFCDAEDHIYDGQPSEVAEFVVGLSADAVSFDRG